MAADVSSLVRLMNGGDTGKSTAPITRDLLGGCCSHDSQELDLDLQVPCGWEKRLDLKSGRVYLQRCNSNSSPSTSENHKPQPSKHSMASFHQDLNFPPKQTLNLLDDAVLDLKLVSPSPAASPSSSNYQSVCTLDKVKSALERAERETGRKRARSMSNKTSSSNSSSSVRDCDGDGVGVRSSPPASFAAGCPNCLMYVLVAGSDPRCPRCGGNVPTPAVSAAGEKPKPPRIDLNIAI